MGVQVAAGGIGTAEGRMACPLGHLSTPTPSCMGEEWDKPIIPVLAWLNVRSVVCVQCVSVYESGMHAFSPASPCPPCLCPRMGRLFATNRRKILHRHEPHRQECMGGREVNRQVGNVQVLAGMQVWAGGVVRMVCGKWPPGSELEKIGSRNEEETSVHPSRPERRRTTKMAWRKVGVVMIPAAFWHAR